MERLSVVIATYNYASYLGAAVDSALGIDWPDVEVVVVDDGSTDDSSTLITSYGRRIVAQRIENSGQREACNVGFSLSTGDVVIFLDADDVLPPDLARAMAPVWTPRVSKVQFQMQRIDAEGVPFSDPFPSWDPTPTPAQVEDWFRRTSAYPTPPGSGNAYARWMLQRVLPAGPEVGDASDSLLLAAAPLLGDVVSLPGVLVGYRQHGANDSDLLHDLRRISREVRRAEQRWTSARRTAGLSDDAAPLFRSRELLHFRVAAARATGEAELLPGDSRRRQLLDALRSPTWPGPERLRRRLVVAAWALVTLCAPPRAVRALLTARYGR